MYGVFKLTQSTSNFKLHTWLNIKVHYTIMDKIQNIKSV